MATATAATRSSSGTTTLGWLRRSTKSRSRCPLWGDVSDELRQSLPELKGDDKWRLYLEPRGGGEDYILYVSHGPADFSKKPDPRNKELPEYELGTCVLTEEETIVGELYPGIHEHSSIRSKWWEPEEGKPYLSVFVGSPRKRERLGNPAATTI